MPRIIAVLIACQENFVGEPSLARFRSDLAPGSRINPSDGNPVLSGMLPNVDRTREIFRPQLILAFARF
jgi:hypothetical protein